MENKLNKFTIYLFGILNQQTILIVCDWIQLSVHDFNYFSTYLIISELYFALGFLFEKYEINVFDGCSRLDFTQFENALLKGE